MYLYGTVDDNTSDFILIHLFFSVPPCENAFSYRDMGNAIPSIRTDSGAVPAARQESFDDNLM